MATARDLSSTRDKVLEILKDWTKHLLANYTKFDQVYVFGSLFSQEGRRFVQTSDVDLVVRISKADASSPTRIVEACEALLVPKRNLEKQLADILGPPSSRQRVSVLAITAFEIEHDIHKDGKQCFYLDNDFLDLNNASFGANPLAHSTATTLTLSPFYFRPLSALQLAQKYRNIFLSVGPIGPSTECGLESWDGPEPVPKENMRAAAMARHFSLRLKDKSSFSDPLVGLEYLHGLVMRWGEHGGEYQELSEWLSVRRGARGRATALAPKRRLLLWEILSHETKKQIGDRLKQEGLSPVARSVPSVLTNEKVFLNLGSGPTLHLGDLDLRSKLFPTHIWDEEDRLQNRYVDDRESERENYIELVWVPSPLPEDLLSRLVNELEAKLASDVLHLGTQHTPETAGSLQVMRETHRRLTEEGSNAYPRLAGTPEISPEDGKMILRVPLGPSKFGVALIREKHLQLPTALELDSKHILNSLAVRVAYVYKDKNGQTWVEFQQRQQRENATYGGAWDVSAAGYIDPERHEDPSAPGRVSPWQACASELAEELRIPSAELPYRDHYFFLGIGRNEPTGQVDLLAYCLGSYVPPKDRLPSPLVIKYERCLFEPETVATFVQEKRRWVPTALLTLILALEAFDRRYTRGVIEKAFARCIGGLDLESEMPR